MSADTERSSLRTRAVRAVLAAVALQALYVLFFVLPGHEPKPNDLPVAVVGQAAPARALEQAGFAVRAVASPEAAQEAILDREVYGAVTQDEVLVSTAASFPVAQLLEQTGRQAGVQRVTDVQPVDPDDPRGTTLNLFVLPLIVTGILIVLVSGGMLPDVDPRGRLLLTALSAFLGSLATVGITAGLIGALPGSYLALVGVTTLGVMAIALPAGALVGLLGPGGIALAFVVFLMLGSPASGLAGAPELLPSPWAELGGLLPPGALGSALKGTAYFDGAKVLGPLAVLVVWCLLGAALQLAAARRAATRAG